MGFESVFFETKIINTDIEGDSKILNIYCLKSNQVKELVYYLLCLLTGGLFYLICYWNTSLKCIFLYSTCELDEATHYLIRNHDDVFTVAEAMIVNNTKGFYNRNLNYFWDNQQKHFRSSKYEPEITIDIIKDLYFNNQKGFLDAQRVIEQKGFYGKCAIDIPVPSIFQTFTSEIFHPFFVFQFFSVCLWIYEDYVIFATIIAVISIITVIYNLVLIRKNIKDLRNMALFKMLIEVGRLNDGKIFFDKIDSIDIVPGDVIIVKNQMKLPCDCLLLAGEVMVNEALLTGESCPVRKQAIHKQSGFEKENVLFEGTNVLKCKGFNEGHYKNINGAVCLVLRTGFQSMKGQLVRNIIYPKPTNFKFHEESMQFITLMGIMTILMYTVILEQLIEELPASELILKLLDSITIAIPPSLPAAINIGISFSIQRLKAKNIICISPPRVIAGGSIDMVCFDKTGTLTENRMDLYGCLMTTGNKFDQMPIEADNETYQKAKIINPQIKLSDQAILCMSCCHSLANIEVNGNHQIMGDPMEEEMYKFVEAKLQDDLQMVITETILNQKIKTVKIFDFNNNLQRMSVVCIDKDNKAISFMKGSPEKIQQLCIPSSIPNDYNEKQTYYSKKGLRLIAMSYKVLNSVPSQTSQREEYEHNQIFLGFLIYENRLKIETFYTINQLNRAQLHSKIVTGDNILTAINVAQECLMINNQEHIYNCDVQNSQIIIERVLPLKDTDISRSKIQESWMHEEFDTLIDQTQNDNKKLLNISFDLDQNKNYTSLVKEFISKINPVLKEHENFDQIVFCCTGQFFQDIFMQQEALESPIMRKILINTRVFARMNPSNKTNLIALLQENKLKVAMIGDGANDCGALKQADVGLALSDAEASIGAPFTAKDLKVSAFIELMILARAGLVTSFQCFKFMAVYSMIQLTTVSILFYNYCYFTDLQFLYIDLFIIVPLFITMSATEPMERISVERPLSSLFAQKNLSSVIGQIILQGLAQLQMTYYMKQQPFYIDPKINKDYFDEHEELIQVSIETTVLFVFTTFLYVTSCLTFMSSKPFKKPFYTNLSFLAVVITLWLYQIAFGVSDETRFEEINENVPEEFLLNVLIISHVWCLIMYLYENYLIGIFISFKSDEIVIKNKN